MAYDTLDIEKRDARATLWLNRPQLRNAFNETMIAELTDAFAALDADSSVRAVVLAGRGKAFCAGADIDWMRRMGELGIEENRRDAMGFGRMLYALQAMRKPTIARVHGAAFAGGIGLIAACDMAVSSAETIFSISEVRLGLTPATISPYVLAAMGERAARRYVLTAERFSAAEAHRIGFVHEIAPVEGLDSKVDAILGELLQGSLAAQAAAKELLAAVARRPLTPELMADMAGRIAAARASEEGREGVRAFLEKRPPSWLPKTR